MEPISKINILRALYQSKDASSTNDNVKVLEQIKNELKVSNDLAEEESNPITNSTKSPYLSDQKFYLRDVVYNSAEETSWRNVKTSEEVENEAREKYLQSNRRKLNII